MSNNNPVKRTISPAAPIFFPFQNSLSFKYFSKTNNIRWHERFSMANRHSSHIVRIAYDTKNYPNKHEIQYIETKLYAKNIR